MNCPTCGQYMKRTDRIRRSVRVAFDKGLITMKPMTGRAAAGSPNQGLVASLADHFGVTRQTIYIAIRAERARRSAAR